MSMWVWVAALWISFLLGFVVGGLFWRRRMAGGESSEFSEQELARFRQSDGLQ